MMTPEGVSITLSDGRVLQIDLTRMSMREYRGLFDTAQGVEADDQIYARVLGLSVDELVDLPQPDYRAATFAVLRSASQPLKDPNSVSASTSA